MDIKALTLSSASQPRKRGKAPRHRSGERFLRGPIPMAWLTAASKASGHGSGFKVAIALWYLSGLNHQAKTVKLKGTVLRDLGVERHAAYRGLDALERLSRLPVAVELLNRRIPVSTCLTNPG